MTPSSGVADPLVSVIVPARNEELCLAKCLKSLVSQQGVSREIIVVDDDSTDRTRDIAESIPGVRVVDAGPLPIGWSGKVNAMLAGARVARGDWLLFTDADTEHQPGSLARALAEAKQHRVALLSYSPAQEVHGFWEKAVMPVIFAELAANYRPSEVSDPASPAAAANGQYLLIFREAYDAIGGHAAVATSLLEDVALARAVKGSGRNLWFRFGGDAVHAHMYRSFRQLKEGWTKNLILLFPSPFVLASARLGEFVLTAGGVVLAIRFLIHGQTKLAVASAILVVGLVTAFFRRIGRAHFPWPGRVFALLGLPIFSYLLLRSRIFHSKGKVTWKGRQCPSSSSSPAGATRGARLAG
ncbi:MAG TPA: glycosyltransferase family 2 protein [Terriglobales bacterium]|nr:glycosyltransferase family 2 protein [Terriglobales bacterium]